MTRLHTRGGNTASPLALAAALGGVAISGTASSQAGGGLEEIVVTAQFVQQSLQETPIAITAVSAEMLEARNQTSIIEVGAQAPNVQLKPAGNIYGPATTAFIRGIGQADTSFTGEPGVGMYVDDVYYSTLLGTLFELVDLDRIEILRGPQGTTAGKNSIGGAVKLYSKKPDDQGGGFLEAAYGSRNRIDVRGSTGFTLISDTLFARLAGLGRRQDGYVKRIDYECAHPGSGLPTYRTSADCELGKEGGKDVVAARASLRWVASDSVEVMLIGDITEDNSGPQATTVTQLTSQRPSEHSITYNGPNGPVALGPQFIPSDPYVTYSTYANPGAGSTATLLDKDYALAPEGKVHDHGISGTVDWELTDNLALKSISAYRTYTAYYTDDAEGSPLDYGTLANLQKHRQYSQEVRLSGAAFEKKLEWTLGAFYFDAKSVVGGRIHLPSSGLPPGLVPFLPAGESLDFIPDDPSVSKSKAGFGQAIWHATDRFNLTAGLRFSKESKDYTFSRADATTGVPGFLLAPIHGRTASFAGDRWDYSVSADYQWTDSFMTYARVATGYRGGGVNPRPFAANQVTSYDPEELDSYELGVKSDLFDRRVRLNLAGFMSKYKNIVVTTSLPYVNADLPICEDPTGATCSTGIYNPAAGTSPSTVPVNGGEATYWGVEFETEIHPTEQLMIDGAVSYLHFEFDKLDPRALLAGLSYSSPLVNAPEWKASLGIQYTLPMGAAGALTPRVDASYQDKVYSLQTRPPTDYNTLEAYTLVNARLSWDSSSGEWGASLACSNCGNKVYYYNKNDLTAIGSTARGTIAPPREYVFAVRRKF